MFNKTKYFTEIIYNSYVHMSVMMRPADIYKIDKESEDTELLKQIDKSRIYFICKRPKIITDTNSVSYDSENVKINFKLLLKDKEVPLEYNYPRKKGQFPEVATDFRVSAYPHEYLELYDKDGGGPFSIPISQMIQMGAGQLAGEYANDILNQEVLYIGQSFSINENKNILDRLKNHSTLQKIVTETQNNDPTFELILYLFEYAPYQLMMNMNGIAGGEINGKEDEEHRKRAIHEVLGSAKEVSLNEATLIRYFEPHYNKIYKDHFPSTNYEVLKECYDLDLFSVAVEVQAEHFGARFFTNKAQPKSHHVAHIHLHDPEERKYFFNKG